MLGQVPEVHDEGYPRQSPELTRYPTWAQRSSSSVEKQTKRRRSIIACRVLVCPESDPVVRQYPQGQVDLTLPRFEVHLVATYLRMQASHHGLREGLQSPGRVRGPSHCHATWLYK